MTNQNLKFLVCCANGSGSSLMAQLALDKVLKRNGIKCKTHHAPLSEGKSTAAQYDVLLCARTLPVCSQMQRQRCKGDSVKECYVR